MSDVRRNPSDVAEFWNPIREIFGLGPLPDVFDRETIIADCPQCPAYTGKGGRCPRHRGIQ